ncbi:hypothetical protein FACS1894116_01370 [Betaproteobacteria bacterium]|nr:hypothetical protein FACS1894116_01370 [Betaproteobacteria bacterium]GHU24917.1 hypothetical protein FACS189488_10630 [Betaproteobacteria bacterium]GHU28444.1 hypothetical protein FACS189497_03910 [Betaproteobacteria bacterium]
MGANEAVAGVFISPAWVRLQDRICLGGVVSRVVALSVYGGRHNGGVCARLNGSGREDWVALGGKEDSVLLVARKFGRCIKSAGFSK